MSGIAGHEGRRASGAPGGRVVVIDGGAGSWAAAKRVADRHGHEDLTLLFADAGGHGDDLYRFVLEAASSVFERPLPDELRARTVAIPSPAEERHRRDHLQGLAAAARRWCPALVWIEPPSAGPAGARSDPRSEALGRRLTSGWLAENRDPAQTVVVLGPEAVGGSLARARREWAPWSVGAPLCESRLDEEELMGWMAAEGLRPPRPDSPTASAAEEGRGGR